MKQLQLPLLRRAIFVDWHGVLSRDPFWASILGSSNHPLHSKLEAKLNEIFSPDVPICHDWMKGTLSTSDIISEMDIHLDRRFNHDYLYRRLNSDCRHLRMNIELLGVLRLVINKTYVVIATDNMDCFVSAFNDARKRHQRSRRPIATLNTNASLWDDIICSCEVGQLKSEDPTIFFGPWLSAHHLRFSDTLLIDDRADNCEAFKKQGGNVIQWKLGGKIEEVIDSLNKWLLTDSEETNVNENSNVDYLCFLKEVYSITKEVE